MVNNGHQFTIECNFVLFVHNWVFLSRGDRGLYAVSLSSCELRGATNPVMAVGEGRQRRGLIQSAD